MIKQNIQRAKTRKLHMFLFNGNNSEFVSCLIKHTVYSEKCLDKNIKFKNKRSSPRDKYKNYLMFKLIPKWIR